jgi:predicted GTPase
MAGFTINDLMRLVEGILEHQPFMNKFKKMCEEEERKLGRVDILIAGKTGAGKSTLVNAVFGTKIAETGIGRPVTDGVTWYEPSHLPLRLCDTRGLELQKFDETLKELQKR